MVRAGNLLTHYRYARCDARVEEAAGELEVRVATGGAADLHVIARGAAAVFLVRITPFVAVLALEKRP